MLDAALDVRTPIAPIDCRDEFAFFNVGEEVLQVSQTWNIRPPDVRIERPGGGWVRQPSALDRDQMPEYVGIEDLFDGAPLRHPYPDLTFDFEVPIRFAGCTDVAGAAERKPHVPQDELPIHALPTQLLCNLQRLALRRFVLEVRRIPFAPGLPRTPSEFFGAPRQYEVARLLAPTWFAGGERRPVDVSRFGGAGAQCEDRQELALERLSAKVGIQPPVSVEKAAQRRGRPGNRRGKVGKLLEPGFEPDRIGAGEHQLDGDSHRTRPPAIEPDRGFRAQDSMRCREPGRYLVAVYRTFVTRGCASDSFRELPRSDTAFRRGDREGVEGSQPEAILEIARLRAVRRWRPGREPPPGGIDVAGQIRKP